MRRVGCPWFVNKTNAFLSLLKCNTKILHVPAFVCVSENIRVYIHTGSWQACIGSCSTFMVWIASNMCSRTFMHNIQIFLPWLRKRHHSDCVIYTVNENDCFTNISLYMHTLFNIKKPDAIQVFHYVIMAKGPVLRCIHVQRMFQEWYRNIPCYNQKMLLWNKSLLGIYQHQILNTSLASLCTGCTITATDLCRCLWPCKV